MKTTENYSNIIKTALFIQRALVFLVFMSAIACVLSLFGLISQFDFRLIAIFILLIYLGLQDWERNLWRWLIEKYEEEQKQQDLENEELLTLCHKLNTQIEKQKLSIH